MALYSPGPIPSHVVGAFMHAALFTWTWPHPKPHYWVPACRHGCLHGFAHIPVFDLHGAIVHPKRHYWGPACMALPTPTSLYLTWRYCGDLAPSPLRPCVHGFAYIVCYGSGDLAPSQAAWLGPCVHGFAYIMCTVYDLALLLRGPNPIPSRIIGALHAWLCLLHCVWAGAVVTGTWPHPKPYYWGPARMALPTSLCMIVTGNRLHNNAACIAYITVFDLALWLRGSGPIPSRIIGPLHGLRRNERWLRRRCLLHSLMRSWRLCCSLAVMPWTCFRQVAWTHSCRKRFDECIGKLPADLPCASVGLWVDGVPCNWDHTESLRSARARVVNGTCFRDACRLALVCNSFLLVPFGRDPKRSAGFEMRR